MFIDLKQKPFSKLQEIEGGGFGCQLGRLAHLVLCLFLFGCCCFLLCYRDLYSVPDNLLLDATAAASPTTTSSRKTYSWMPLARNIKVFDFGLSTFLKHLCDKLLHTTCGPRLHRAEDPPLCPLRQLEAQLLLLRRYPLQPPCLPPSRVSLNTF